MPITPKFVFLFFTLLPSFFLKYAAAGSHHRQHHSSTPAFVSLIWWFVKVVVQCDDVPVVAWFHIEREEREIKREMVFELCNRVI
ncbi:hypothetical protein Hanom_Chr11g00980421 [Helianthus anomalus]